VFTHSWPWLYLASGIVSYYLFYSNAAEVIRRLPAEAQEHVLWNTETAVWRWMLIREREIIKLLTFDFFKIHCPWNKQTSIKYRVQRAKELLQTMTHEKGWTAMDCDNPALQVQIARDCFESRFRFWGTETTVMLSCPVRVILLVLLSTLIVVVALCHDLRYMFTSR